MKYNKLSLDTILGLYPNISPDSNHFSCNFFIDILCSFASEDNIVFIIDVYASRGTFGLKIVAVGLIG